LCIFSLENISQYIGARCGYVVHLMRTCKTIAISIYQKSFLRAKIGFQRCVPISSNTLAGRGCELKLAVKRAHRGLLAVSANALLPMGRASLEPDSGPQE